MNKTFDSVGLTRREALGSAALWAAGLPVLLNAGSPLQMRPKAHSVILLWLDGGPSQIETFDPLPSSVKAIPTSVPGLHISSLMPRMAKRMNCVTLIKGVSQPDISHDRACRSLLTCDMGMGRDIIPPSLGSLTAYRHRSAHSTRDPYLVFGKAGFGNGYGGAGTLGVRFEPKIISPKLAALINRDRESERAIERYGDNEFGASCLAARCAIESGSVFVTVVSSGWDTHADAIQMAQASLVPHLDRGLSALIDDLHQRGLLDSTLLVAMGEFGRTAELNALHGRDHDPEAGFALLAGTGVPSGQVIDNQSGKNSDTPKSPVTPRSITSTILWKLGIGDDACRPIPGLA